MALPDDEKHVIKAFRLGWHVAEVRGRNRPDGLPGANTPMPVGDRYALRLRTERAPVELRIDAQAVLEKLAQELGVDDDSDGGSYGNLISQNAHRLSKARIYGASDDAPWDALWDGLAELLWNFDAHVQDVLTVTSEMQASAYQLGRGLAETYWALAPMATNGAQSWQFLFGQHRVAELSRLIGHLSAYLNTYTGLAMAGSIEIWKDFADRHFDVQTDTVQAYESLHNQIRRWYELVVLAQDPTKLTRTFDAVGSYLTFTRAIKQFVPQVVVTVIGLGVLVGLLSGGETSGLVKTIGAVLAAAGVSIGGVTGALKNSAKNVLTRVRQDTYTELVTEAVTVRPPGMTRREMRKAMAHRN